MTNTTSYVRKPSYLLTCACQQMLYLSWKSMGGVTTFHTNKVTKNMSSLHARSVRMYVIDITSFEVT